MACTRVRKKARTSCDYGWIEPNTGMPHTMQHAHSFATCFQHGALFQQLAPFLVPLTSFMLITTNWLMQDMVSRSTAPLRLSLSVREMDRKWGDINICMEKPLAILARPAPRLGTSRPPSRVTSHTVFLWRLISFFADVLSLGPREINTLTLTLGEKLRQQPWHPVAGILWSDRRDATVLMKIMRQRRASELLGLRGTRCRL